MKRFFLTFLIGLLFTGFAFATGVSGADKAGRSLFDVWNADQNTAIELHINFDTLETYRRTLNSLPATVIQDGKSLELDVTIRGRFRRRTCAMPPMKLQFKKNGLRALGLNTHNDFKLVTHCTNDEAGQDALQREKLAYELYQTINPQASFRTQLLTVTYVNTVDGATTTSYAILIEDYDELKNRLDAKSCDDCYNMPIEQIANAETVTLFQYMIGNSDFSTKMVRNLKLVSTADGSNTFIPYDFDYSGLVNATYAKGMPHYKEAKVTDRTLIWDFGATADFDAAAEQLAGHKDTLLNQVLNFDGMSDASKKEITKYLKGFFRQLKSKSFNVAK